MTTARRTGATSLATLAACVAAFIAVHMLAPQWARSAGLDFWEASNEAEARQREKQREQDIEDQSNRLAQQIGAAESIAAAVIDDRLGFDEAVDQIVEINRDRPGFPDALRPHHVHTTTERGLWEHYLRGKVQAKLADDPSRQSEVMNRLTCR